MFKTLTIKNVRQETAESVSLAFDKMPYEAGQYLTLRATIDGEDLRRAYSICSSPHESEMRVAIKQVDGGLFSSYAQNLKAGDTLEVMPPQGRFTLKTDKNHVKTYVFIAVGSGITPILSHIKTLLQLETLAKIILIYGNKTTASVMFREEIEDLKDQHLNRFSVHHILSREASDIALLHGRIDEDKIKILLHGIKADHAFICGPEALTKIELAAHNHFELFTPATGKRGMAKAPTIQSDLSVTMTLKFEGQSHLVPMSPDETVLDAATRHGLDLPFSCKGGMCCTCRAHISEGTAEMNVNYSLEAWEIERGFTLTCQAKPKTETITIDFDEL
jgi:ring-1,2-phenylacetyl-CoA epoxidase subunit PaaE